MNQSGRNNRQGVNLIDFDSEEEMAHIEEYPLPDPAIEQDKVAAARAVLETMSLEDKERLAREMGVEEDFPSA
jgi:hypothetical protein